MQQSTNQSQTKESFGYKWSRRDTYESSAIEQNARNWLFERYCHNNAAKLNTWLQGSRKLILDAGCGSGFSSLLFFSDYINDHNFVSMDISSAIKIAQDRFIKKDKLGAFIQGDASITPFKDKSFDLIFSEGVMHHTDSTEKTLKHLSAKLKHNGRFLFYVYAKKGPIREFTDDYIRNYLAPMTDEQAWQALEPLTKLGIEFGKTNSEIEIPEDIPYLGIKRGKINLQRFFYWTICKTFFRSEYSLDEMNHVNYDWFRPMNCHRQTPEEVTKWCCDAGLNIEHMDIQDAGITVVAVKN
jgi:arsenite methyltransferase